MITPQSKLVAVLGPTNTGKTFTAIEKMLEFNSGIFGLPLRLLAREVYEKCVSKVGQEKVALITGEEKIIPSTAQYFICTVEAMPKNKVVDFIAVDEIQMCGALFPKIHQRAMSMFKNASNQKTDGTLKNQLYKINNFVAWSKKIHQL